MRVLHVYKTYYPDTYGGIEQVIYQLSQGCARRGIAADVFTFSPDKDTGPVAYEDHRVIYNKQLFEIASTPFSLKALKRFKLIKDDYDIINYHFPFPFMDMLHLSARPDARTVVTYHSDIVKQKRLMKLPAAAGAISQRRRLHRCLVAQLRGFQPNPEKISG